jgi:hypothetical protein
LAQARVPGSRPLDEITAINEKHITISAFHGSHELVRFVLVSLRHPETWIGGERRLKELEDDPLPRIC